MQSNSCLLQVSAVLIQHVRDRIGSDGIETRLELAADVAISCVRLGILDENVCSERRGGSKKCCRCSETSYNLFHLDWEKGNKDFYILNLLVQIVNAILLSP